MNEIEFAEQIDCKFPYHDTEQAAALIAQARSISSAAMFMALEEICRPPIGTDASRDQIFGLIDKWSLLCDHPLADQTVSAAKAVASGATWPVEKSLALLERVAGFEGLYGALNIAYFSCDDVDGVIEPEFERIRKDWETNAGA
ncbi:hypothetical protein K3725_12600 [Leisingera sp. S132]|uniref:hypothetical protein n=1 Tax=Leisingera sp. S132 TaxID=2867016 RepID=UPI0021A90DA6|nr:hypothetical protein [Leisingera sp. S132]UWQ78155.1 hypothetical protein K3725_12600 [Leisingera sp. S132]